MAEDKRRAAGNGQDGDSTLFALLSAEAAEISKQSLLFGWGVLLDLTAVFALDAFRVFHACLSFRDW